MRAAVPFILLVFAATRSQECRPPEWYGRLPTGYAVGIGRGTTAESAATAAWNDLFAELARMNTVQVDGRFSLLQGRGAEGRIEEVRNHLDASGTYARNGAPLFTLLDTYRTPRPCVDNQYAHYLLVCLAGAGCACRMHQPSNGAALARSLIVPGWGQAYKGSTGRGVAFLTGTVAMAATAAACLTLSGQNQNRAAHAVTAPVRQYYSGWRDGTFYAGFAMGIAASGLYAWNVFDAFHRQGRPRLE